MCVCWVMSSKFMPSLQAALNVCWYYVWTAVFNRLPQLAPTVLLPHMVPPLDLHPLSFPCLGLFSTFSDFFSSWPFLSSAVSVAACFYLRSCFIFFSCSVWHICCCLVGRLCSPVINLFCRSPSALSAWCFSPSLSPPPPTLRCLLFFQRSSLHWHHTQ